MRIGRFLASLLAILSGACTTDSPRLDVEVDRAILVGATTNEMTIVNLSDSTQVAMFKFDSFSRVDRDIFLTTDKAYGVAQTRRNRRGAGGSVVFSMDLRDGLVSSIAAPPAYFLWSSDGRRLPSEASSDSELLYILAQHVIDQDAASTVEGRMTPVFDIIRFEVSSSEFTHVVRIPSTIGIPQRIRISPSGMWASIRAKPLTETGDLTMRGPTSVAFFNLKTGAFHGAVRVEGLLTRAVFTTDKALHASTIDGRIFRFDPQALTKREIVLPNTPGASPSEPRQKLLGNAAMLSSTHTGKLLAAVRESGATRAWVLDAETDRVHYEVEVPTEVGWVSISRDTIYFRAYPMTPERWASPERLKGMYMETFYSIAFNDTSRVEPASKKQEPLRVFNVELPRSMLDQSPFFVAMPPECIGYR